MGTERNTIGARELRARLGKYLRAVRDGATLIITERSEPVAELRPIPRPAADLHSRFRELASQGFLSVGSGMPIGARNPITVRGEPLSKTVSDEREDRFDSIFR